MRATGKLDNNGCHESAIVRYNHCDSCGHKLGLELTRSSHRSPNKSYTGPNVASTLVLNPRTLSAQLLRSFAAMSWLSGIVFVEHEEFCVSFPQFVL